VRNFAIECKRLGSPSSPGWNFNTRYVGDGVRRFTDCEWRYGADVASGAMVGYVESQTPREIIADVNEALTELGVSPLTIPFATDNWITEMEHSMDRPFEVNLFRLVHLWIDIRPTGGQRKMHRVTAARNG
jgi:hypothetical protein